MIFSDIRKILSHVISSQEKLTQVSEQILFLKKQNDDQKVEIVVLRDKLKDLTIVQNQIMAYNERAIEHSMRIQDEFASGVNSLLGS